MTDHTYSNLVQTKLPQSFSIRELLKRREQKAPSELMPAMLRASVPAPPSVVALARALKHDVDLIYEWVYSNVDFYGTWGARKGAFGALVDRAANACDQSILMVALLQASGYTAEFVVGSIRLAKEQLENLLGTADDSESNPSSAQMLSAGGIFNTPTYVDGELEYIDLDHVWVRVVIDGVYYMFDPTFKTYTYTAMVEDLGEILDYDESALTTAAQVGATVDGRSVQNLNKPNIFEKFQTYGTNLLDYLREEENFAASMEDVIGGREIQPLSGTPVRQTSLPYQTPDEEPSYYEDNLPDELRYLYKVSVGGLEEIFYFDAVYGKRMTITFNGSMEPELKLDGVLQAGGDEQTPDVFITATYGIGVEPDELVTWTQRLYTDPDGVTFLAMAWGPTSQSMVDYHRQVLQQNISAGGVDGDENVLGESLAVYHFMHEAQLTAAHRICGQLGNSSIFHRALGTVSWTSFSQGPLFDYAFNSLSASSRINDFSTASKTKAAACLYVFGLEGAIVQQNLPVMGISTARFLEQTTQKIYSGNVLNWFTGPTVRDLLTNWTLAPLDAVILSDGEVVVHQDGESTIGDFVGGGYMDIRNSDNISGILAGQLFGGAGSEPTSKEQMNKGAKDSPPKSNNPCPCPCGSPISLFRGSMVEDWGDISVGSGAFPYSLTFSRHYDSQQRFSAGPLGAGWTHNLDARVSVGSNALRALGELSPKEAAAAIAHIFVAIQLDIPSEQITNHLKTVIAVISMQWLFDELCTNNSVMFTEGGASSTFIKLVDGTYNPQFGSADTLTLDGTFSIKSPQQLTWNFNSDGQLETYVDPAGVTVTYTYSSGLLQSVSNGLDRTLTFSYEDGLLESVSDGDRSVSFAIEDGNLVAFTDAESNSTTYAYVALGLMNEYFRPANPLVPMVVNTFDSGGNVLTQTPANEGTSNYFCSGFRAERVNALGNSTVTYFNSYGSPLREFDAEGNETVYEYDGLNRLVGTTYPEGNRLLLEYDNSSVEVSQNILKKTWQAKPGSLLSDIEQVLEYDTPWNKVASAKDGEGNTTIFSYDATQGTLIQTNRPSLTTVSVTTITIAGAPPSGPYLQTVRVAGQAATYLADTGDSDSDIAGALSTAINALSLSGVSSTSSGADILLTAPVGTTLTATGLGGITISNAIFVNLGYTYTARGQVETRTDETGIVDKFEYNATNETLEKATRDFGMGRLNLETQFGYNAWGDVNSITDPRGNTTTFDFDQERRMIERVECAPFEFQTIWEYNPNGELIRLKRQAEPGPDPELFQEWQWAYRVNGDVETITDPAGNLLTFVYNLIALLISRTDAEGRQWKFAYDANNRITVVTDPSGNASETRTYTDNGMLASITDARGNTTTMSQDGFDRLETRTYPDTTTEEFTYNQNNQVLTLVTRNGDTIENTYDVLTRLSTRLAGTLPLQTMQYDLAGRLEKVSTPAVEADPSSGEFGFGYDTAGRLTSQSSPTGEDPPVYREIQYELDQNGNRTKLIYPDAYFAFYVFDELNRLTDIKLDSEVDPSAIQFVYDELSRRTGLTYINGCSCVYTYLINNDMESLEHSFDGSSVAFAFGYNKVHQVTSTSIDNPDYSWPEPTAFSKKKYGTANNLNQYPSVSGDAFGYDNNGNLTSGPFGATYDPLNRVTQIVSGGTTVDYLNDPLNRQAQKEVDSVKTLYLTDGAQLIAEYDDTQALVNRYIPGARLDEILIKIAGATTTFFHMDRLGSTIAQTDDSGVVLEKYKYSAFGETPSLAGTIFGFTGQRYDSEIAQYNYKARYYSPEIGRFLQPDSLGYSAGGMNLYSYVGNNSLNMTDPFGLQGCRIGEGDDSDDSEGYTPFTPHREGTIDETFADIIYERLLLAQALPGPKKKLYLKGIASVYGDEFDGGPVKGDPSGKTRFSQKELSAAVSDVGIFPKSERGILIPFKATVTNLDNGKSVELTINDTGSFGRKYGRVIDLSKAAFLKLGGTYSLEWHKHGPRGPKMVPSNNLNVKVEIDGGP